MAKSANPFSSQHLCSPAELDKLLAEGDVQVLDCSWYLPAQQIDTRKAYLELHIPGALFFHIDLVCDRNSDLPHMLPTAEDFSLQVSELGINNGSNIVVYDSAGIFSAARVWWMFQVFGHQRVRVLNGGLPAWMEFGGRLSNKPVATNHQASDKAGFRPSFNSQMVTSKTQLLANCESKELVVLDARSAGRFMGLAPEPRPGLPSGHMPQSISLPFDQLLENGKLRSVDSLRSIFMELGISANTSVVTSCGSGVTAAIINLALAESGFGLQRLYDGSWSEWGSAHNTPILNPGFAQNN